MIKEDIRYHLNPLTCSMCGEKFCITVNDNQGNDLCMTDCSRKHGFEVTMSIINELKNKTDCKYPREQWSTPMNEIPKDILDDIQWVRRKK